MEWTFAPCSCCKDSVLVPAATARRVFDGTSHLLCEKCMELPLYEVEDDDA
jgi:hypothetical protein